MAQNIDIRGFTWEDLESVAELFNRVGDAAGTEKELDSEVVRQNLSVPSVSPETNLRLAVNGTDLVGYHLLSPEPLIGRAVIVGGAIPEFRDSGILTRLLRDSVERAEEAGARVVHFQTALDAHDDRRLLESEGFEKIKEFWQMRWEGSELPPLRLRPGFRLKSFELDRDEAMLTELQNTAFGENWGFSPNNVDQIAARVRVKISPPDGVIFIMDGDSAAAYNWTQRIQNAHGHIGFVAMTGVHPSYRGSGLGTAIVVAGMEHLLSRGVDAVELEVDAENIPARELYLKLGYRRVHHSVWYELKLGNSVS
ncbi:MAG: GNAT family N-acetyltransferase [Dehalococcoidia bacterium]|nr:GNAT family N-acetyltransferase [Dehalococcoidia bacterium]